MSKDLPDQPLNYCTKKCDDEKQQCLFFSMTDIANPNIFAMQQCQNNYNLCIKECLLGASKNSNESTYDTI